jgi:hypothetical protein
MSVYLKETLAAQTQMESEQRERESQLEQRQGARRKSVEFDVERFVKPVTLPAEALASVRLRGHALAGAIGKML